MLPSSKYYLCVLTDFPCLFYYISLPLTALSFYRAPVSFNHFKNVLQSQFPRCPPNKYSPLYSNYFCSFRQALRPFQQTESSFRIFVSSFKLPLLLVALYKNKYLFHFYQSSIAYYFFYICVKISSRWVFCKCLPHYTLWAVCSQIVNSVIVKIHNSFWLSTNRSFLLFLNYETNQH